MRAALAIYAVQAARQRSLALNPTGTFEWFGMCLPCGSGNSSFLQLPNGNVTFSLDVDHRKNLAPASGEPRIANREAMYSHADSDCKLTFKFTHATVVLHSRVNVASTACMRTVST